MRPETSMITRIASLIGIIQSCCWCILSAICIIMYASQPLDLAKENWNPSYNRFVSLNLYGFFLQTNYQREFCPNCTVTPKVFCIFMSIYLVSSAVWCYYSGRLYLSVTHRTNNTDLLQKQMINWSIYTFLVTVLDLIFFFILFADYNVECDLAAIYARGNCHLAFGIVMTLAAKGFVLLVVNGGFAYVVYRCAKTSLIDEPVRGRGAQNHVQINQVHFNDPQQRTGVVNPQ